MRYLKNLLKFMLLPYHRALGMRRDDGGQVIVLTGVMVFVAMIMAIATMNSGMLLFNRVRAQNAVDAAADLLCRLPGPGPQFLAAPERRPLLGELDHLRAGIRGVGGAHRLAPLRHPAPTRVLRLQYVPPVLRDSHGRGQFLDDAQDTIADLILGVQSVIDTVFPILGALSANGLAEANGADKVLEWVGEIGSQLGGMIGVDLSFLQSLTSSLASIPGLGDIYVICLKPGQLISLNTEEKDPDPDSLPWDTLGIIEGLVIVSDIACALAVSIAMSDEPIMGTGGGTTPITVGGPVTTPGWRARRSTTSFRGWRTSLG